MHVFFSGIGGVGIGGLALIAKQAGYEVSGSDKQESDYFESLRSKGITAIHVGQTTKRIQDIHEHTPIDWIVYSSAVEKENPNHPEIMFAREHGIRATKRDEFLNALLQDTGQKLIAVAGTHGKTTTTAMIIWLLQALNIPLSYSVGGKLPNGSIGHFDPSAEYFVYEADEYDRNFLSFHPEMSAIAGVDYDHPDVYPTRSDYYKAFLEFIQQSRRTIIWKADADKIDIAESDIVTTLASDTSLDHIRLGGQVNRMNAHVAIVAVEKLGLCSYEDAVSIMNKFPGISRRFEKITDNIYSDYAHTPEKIRGAIQLVQEIAGDNIVVVYEGLHNTRQHFIKDELKSLFAGVKKLYIVPSYLAREDESLEHLTPQKLCQIVKQPQDCQPAQLDDALRFAIKEHVHAKDTVLCLSAGGGGSLDEWLRKGFSPSRTENYINDR